MLLRWDIENPGQLAPIPTPVPDWEGCVAVPSHSLPLARIGDRLGAADPVANSATWAASVGAGTTGGGTAGGGTTAGTPPPPTYAYTLTSADYRVSKKEWRVQGRISNTGAGVTVQVFLGGSVTGTLIGSVTTNATGDFDLRKVNPPKGTFTTISIQASNGATLLNQTFTNN